MKTKPDFASGICYALFVCFVLWKVGGVAYTAFLDWHHAHYISVDDSHPILKDNFWPNHGPSSIPLLMDRKAESLLGPSGDNTIKGLLGPLPEKNDPARKSMVEELIGKKK